MKQSDTEYLREALRAKYRGSITVRILSTPNMAKRLCVSIKVDDWGCQIDFIMNYNFNHCKFWTIPEAVRHISADYKAFIKKKTEIPL